MTVNQKGKSRNQSSFGNATMTTGIHYNQLDPYDLSRNSKRQQLGTQALSLARSKLRDSTSTAKLLKKYDRHLPLAKGSASPIDVPTMDFQQLKQLKKQMAKEAKFEDQMNNRDKFGPKSSYGAAKWASQNLSRDSSTQNLKQSGFEGRKTTMAIGRIEEAVGMAVRAQTSQRTDRSIPKRPLKAYTPSIDVEDEPDQKQAIME